MVLFEMHTSGKYTLYSISVENVQLRGRYPRYIHAVKELYGDVGKLICEDILQQGQSLMSQVRCCKFHFSFAEFKRNLCVKCS